MKIYGDLTRGTDAEGEAWEAYCPWALDEYPDLGGDA